MSRYIEKELRALGVNPLDGLVSILIGGSCQPLFSEGIPLPIRLGKCERYIRTYNHITAYFQSPDTQGEVRVQWNIKE